MKTRKKPHREIFFLNPFSAWYQEETAWFSSGYQEETGRPVGHERGPGKTFLTSDRLDLNLFDAPEPLVASVWLKTPTFDKFQQK